MGLYCLLSVRIFRVNSVNLFMTKAIIVTLSQQINLYDRQRQKMYLLACAPSEDSDQTAHSRSLIRIFTWRILVIIVGLVSLYGQRRLVRLCRLI